MGQGLTIERRFTTEGQDVYETVEWSSRDSRITNPDGSVVFEMLGAEIPAQWSQVAADIMVSKYFRKAGVPVHDEAGNAIVDEDGQSVTGSETSARQVIKRLAATWRWWGETNGYFAEETDAAAFEDELAYMLLHQMAAPNSPQWFNTGLNHEYGITGTEQGFWFVDPATEEVTASEDAYSRPAPHACFPEGTQISLRDDFKPIEKIEPGDDVLTHEGRYRTVTETMQRQVEGELVRLRITKLAATDLVATENHPILAVRQGSSTPDWIDAGDLRKGDYVVVGEPQSSNATPSEMRLGDGSVAYPIERATRESFFGTVYNFQVAEDESYVANGVAVHNCFINSVDDDLVNEGGIMDLWVREARLFKMGAGSGANFSHIRAEGEPLSGGGKSSGLMSFLKVGDRAAGAIKSGGTTRRAAKMVIVDIDHPDIETFIKWKAEEEKKVRALVAGGYSADFNGEAYATVAGQNSNNSVRLSNAFLTAVLHDQEWDLLTRTDRSVMKTVKARDLWDQIADAAWQSADPGLQFHGTINEWHTSPAEGEIRASNPCSEYMFLDNTACNLASLNLGKFYDDHTGSFNIESYHHAVRLWTIVLEISVTMAQFPSKEIAIGSYDYRTLGLGYANLGSLLMRMGIPYDSDHGRAIAGALTAILTGYSYATSAEMAGVLGPFPKYETNRDSMLRVIRNHRRAAYNKDRGDYEGVSHYVMGINSGMAPLDMIEAARTAWDTALTWGEQHGFRNAQVSVLAPTGCLVGGSLIPTERGLVRLKSLGDTNGAEWQDLDVEIGTDEGPRNASQFYINGVDDVVTVDTHRGYRIQGTPMHRIKVLTETGEMAWKRFGEITSDDIVPLQLNQMIGEPQTVTLPPLAEAYWTSDHTTTVPRTMNADLAEFLGYFMGDGSLHSKGIRLAVAQEDFDVVERLRLLGKELFGLEAHATARGGYTEVAFHSVRLTLWWEACGFAKHSPLEGHTGKGYHPHIPDAVLHSNDSAVYAAFVRGLFEADGTVMADGYPSWSTTSLDFSRDVQSLLLAMGYPTTRKMDRTGWGASDLAVLRLLNLSYNDAWAEEIGFMSARKQNAIATGDHPQTARHDHIPVSRGMIDRLAPENDDLRKRLLQGLTRNGMVTRRAAIDLLERTGDAELAHLLGFFYDRVTSAELGEEQYTYDLSVPDNVTYVANGFVSHNTIGLLMDCDTTGVEPDFALVKFKKLAGGGYFKIANQSIAPALSRLGYSDNTIQRIIEYVVGTNSLARAPHINMATLIAKGFTADDLDKIEAVLPGVFEIGFAFNQWTLGEEVMQRLGFTPDQYTAPEFSMLKALGFSDTEIQEANDYICGRQTIEGAPHLRDEHLPVFDTANRNGRFGKRFIHHNGHINMMAAAQPFISGAISKTINMPNEVTREDIAESYKTSWEFGLKAVAIYRDGSKASQPLSSQSDDGYADDEPAELEEALAEEIELVSHGRVPWHETIRPGVSPTTAYEDMKRPRFLLPGRRQGYTQEARVGGHKVFLRTGEYEDGTLGELFIDLAKEGATLRGILSCFAIAVSKGLQYGVPLEEYVETFTFQTFEPRGMVEGHPNIKMANSLIDYVFRALGVEYLQQDELAQVPPDRSLELPEPPKGLAVDAGIQLDLRDAAAEDAVNATVEAAEFADAEVVAPVSGGSGVTETVVETSQDSYRNSGALTATPPAPAASNGGVATTAAVQQQAMQSALADKMGDAPICDTCGAITVRNGSCYVCLGCGGTTGCS